MSSSRCALVKPTMSTPNRPQTWPSAGRRGGVALTRLTSGPFLCARRQEWILALVPDVVVSPERHEFVLAQFVWRHLRSEYAASGERPRVNQDASEGSVLAVMPATRRARWTNERQAVPVD